MSAVLQITFSVNQPFREWFGEALLHSVPEGLHGYAARLVGAIHQPLPVTVTVGIEDATDGQNRLIVNGNSVAIAGLIPDKPAFLTDEQFCSQYLGEVLFRHRTLLVHESVYGGLGEKHGIEMSEAQALIRLAVNECYAPLLLSTGGPMTLQHPVYNWFEDAVVHSDAIGIRLEVSPSVMSSHHPLDQFPVGELTELLVQGLYNELGILLPLPEITTDDSLPQYACRVSWNCLPLPDLHTVSAENFVCDRVSADPSMGLQHPGQLQHPRQAAVYSLRPTESYNSAFCGHTWGTWGLLILQLSRYARLYGHAVMNGFAVQTLLDALAGHDRLKAYGLGRRGQAYLVQTVRHLVSQGVPVRNFHRILEGIVLAGDTFLSDPAAIEFLHHPMVLASDEVDPEQRRAALQQPWQMAELLRNYYLRYDLQFHLSGYQMLNVFLIDHEVEQWLYGNPHYAQISDAIIRELDFELRYQDPQQSLHCILTTDAIRHKVEELVSGAYPFLRVVSYGELPPDVSINPVTRLSVKLPEEDANGDSSRVQDDNPAGDWKFRSDAGNTGLPGNALSAD